MLKVVFSIGRWVLCFDLGMAFVDNGGVGKEEVCYWLSNDIVGLVGNLAV